jgi:hypothetical protein
MFLLSLTGVLKIGLIILGVMFLLKIMGNISQARRNVADQDRMRREEEAARQTVETAKKNYGKTTISKIDESSKNSGGFVDFEEVQD